MKKKGILFLNLILLLGCLLFFVLKPVLAGPIRLRIAGEQEIESILEARTQVLEPFLQSLLFPGKSFLLTGILLPFTFRLICRLRLGKRVS